jgi:molybdopterin-guanine dinucleotide biosynthesis protein A
MSSDCVGILLTGGASTRMGVDKATLRIDDVTLAERNGALLQEVCGTAIEVGPGFSQLRSVREDPPGGGPLRAIVAAFESLPKPASLLVCAVDMPLLTASFLRFLLEYPSPLSVIPVVDHRAQPLCARWSVAALEAACLLAGRGERSMQALLCEVNHVLVEHTEWSQVAAPSVLLDADTPERWAEIHSLTGKAPGGVAPIATVTPTDIARAGEP